MPFDPPPGEAARPALAEFLRRERATILSTWKERVRSLPIARTLSHEELLDHLPHLLERLAGMVEDLEARRPVRDTGPIPDAHALERLEEGYDLDEVVQEFAALRECVLELWARQPNRTQGTPVLNRAIDESIATAVTRYSRARERTLVALDRISAAAMESTDFDALLQSLVRVLLETTASVDSVALYLRDGRRLDRRAAVGIDDESAPCSVEVGSRTCAGQIAAGREPLELRDVATSSLSSESLCRHGARAFYGVPMLREGEVVGVAHMASRTAYEFSNEDKLLFRAMVERATTAILQRRLQDALERERRRLQESEERFRALVSSSSQIVWTTNAQGEVVEDSPTWRAFTGQSREQFQGHGWLDAIHPDDRRAVAAAWRQATEGRAMYETVCRLRHVGGEWRWMEVRGSPLVAPDGTLRGWVGMNTDVTERRKAEERLRESEERFRTLADNMAQLAWMADTTGARQWFNRRWLDYTGMTVDEAQGFGWRRAHHPAHRETVDARYRRHVEAGAPWEDTVVLRGRDGGYRTFLSHALPIRDEQTGEVVRWFGTNTDITDRIALEEERSAAMERERQAWREAERTAAMLDALFAGAPVGLAFFDREFRYVRINDVLAQANGHAPHEHRGKTPVEVLGPVAAPLQEQLKNVLASGKPITGLEVSLAPPTAPHQVRDWLLSVYPARLADGSIVGLGTAVVDVTDLKQALRARDEFLSVAAHDLRSPLTSLRLLLDSILRRALSGAATADPEWLQRKLDKATHQTERVARLLDDLLDVSRIHTGTLHLELEDVDLAALVRDVAGRHLELLASKGCELRLSAPGAIVGRWDSLRLEQVVTNLLSNAAKFGAGQPVEVRVAAADGAATLTVTDHGVGIAPENQARLFERFQRVGDTRAFAGTGLGLWITRNIVQALGGAIDVRSAPGQGATFTVTLPRAGPPAENGAKR